MLTTSPPTGRPGTEPPAIDDFPLGIADFRYRDLHDPRRLADLLACFDSSLAEHDAELASRLLAWRAAGGTGLSEVESSALVVAAEKLKQVLAKQQGCEADLILPAIADALESIDTPGGGQ